MCAKPLVGWCAGPDTASQCRCSPVPFLVRPLPMEGGERFGESLSNPALTVPEHVS